MKMTTLIYAFMFLVAVGAQQLTSDKCYYEYLNTKVMCLEPCEVCKNVANCEDCMAICTQYTGTCQAVVYQQSTQECSIYHKAVQPSYGRKKRAAGCYGNMPPSLKKNEPDFTYYVVSNNSCCNRGFSGASAAPSVVTNLPVSPVQINQPPPPPTMLPTPATTTIVPLLPAITTMAPQQATTTTIAPAQVESTTVAPTQEETTTM